MTKVNSPLISIIIPYYSPRFDFFVEAVESILSQSYINWEAIIVNDGSSIESKRNLEKFINELGDNRISLVHLDKNYGPGVARNKGIEACIGDIVTFLDADDLIFPWHLEQIRENFALNPDNQILSAYYTYYLHPWKVGRFYSTSALPNEILKEIKQAKRFLPPQLSFRKDIFKTIRFDPEFYFLEDTDLCLQILKKEELLNYTSFLPTYSYLYRLYPSKNRHSHKVDLLFIFREKIINKYALQDSLASKSIKSWQSSIDQWKFNKALTDFLNKGSVLKYLRSTFSEFQSLKDKIKSIRALVNLILKHKFLIPVLGIDQRYLELLLEVKNNRYSVFKKKFREYLNTVQDERSRFYAKQLFERVFSS